MNKFIKKFFKQRKPFVIVELLLLVIILVLVGMFLFKGNEEKPKQPTTNNNETTKPEETKKVSIVDINTTSRPYAVMINNISTARPLQSGLQDTSGQER